MKRVKYMLKKRTFAIICFLFMAIGIGNVIANTDVDKSPSSVVLGYIDSVASGSFEQAYDMLSNKDKKIITLEKFRSGDNYYGLNSQTRSQFLKLFNLKIVNVDIIDRTAKIEYLNHGPHELYMNAWENVSRRNEDSIKNGNKIILTSKQSLSELNSEVLILIQEKNYHESDVKKSIELIMEGSEWKVNLDSNIKEKLRNAIILTGKVDNELERIKNSAINTVGNDRENNERKISSIIDEYQQIKKNLAALRPIYEDDHKLQNDILDTLNKRIANTKLYIQGGH
jgi:hypothetical protein